MRKDKERARRDAATSKRAKKESHQAGGNPYQEFRPRYVSALGIPAHESLGAYPGQDTAGF